MQTQQTSGKGVRSAGERQTGWRPVSNCLLSWQRTNEAPDNNRAICARDCIRQNDVTEQIAAAAGPLIEAKLLQLVYRST